MVTLKHLNPVLMRRDYGDIRGEVRACREQAALFDFSFMHSVRIQGASAGRLVQSLTSRSIEDLPVGRMRYALRLDAAGLVLADMTIWRIDTDTFDVFSGRADEIVALVALSSASARTIELSAATRIFAVQGTDSLRALANHLSQDATQALLGLRYFAHLEAMVAGIRCRIGRLGYTGERGFEIIVPAAASARLWTALASCARPAGFAAVDTLRIEAGFLLFANELQFPVMPVDLGLERFAPSTSVGLRAHRLLSGDVHNRPPSVAGARE